MLATSAESATAGSAAVGASTKAFSYVRFSTPEQAKGDSHNRQIGKAKAYAKAHGLDFDETLTFKDAGVSAWKHANAETGRLKEFRDAVKQGLIPRGSFLLIESLDRLSRNKPRKALRLLEEICESGITVVTTVDERRYDEKTLDEDPLALMYALMVAIRANEENERKSERVGNAYRTKRQEAIERLGQGKPFTRMLPAWLRWNETTKTIEPDPQRTEVLQSIFEKANADWGQHRIAHWLNQTGKPTFGGVGKQRKAERWHRSYVKKLLSNRAVIGTFTPQQRTTDQGGKKRRKPLEAIESYFPAVVDPEVFERVASRMKATAARGRNAGADAASIFAGLLRCARCGGTATRVAKGSYVYLVCSRAHRKNGCHYLAVPYKEVERAFRRNARAIIRGAPRGKEAEEIDAEIANRETAVDHLMEKASEIADELVAEKSEVLRQQLRDKETELEKAKAELKALRVKRNAEVAPFVHRRLLSLDEALRRKPFSVPEVNKALKETASRIVLNPEEGRLWVYWHHHEGGPTDGGAFYSRHMKSAFPDDAEDAA